MNLDLKSGAPLSKSQESLSVEIWKSISDDPRCFTKQRSTISFGFFLLVKRENEFGYDDNRLMGIKILYYSMVVTDNRFNFVIRQFSGLTLVDNQLLAGLCRSQLRSHQMTL